MHSLHLNFNFLGYPLWKENLRWAKVSSSPIDLLSQVCCTKWKLNNGYLRARLTALQTMRRSDCCIYVDLRLVHKGLLFSCNSSIAWIRLRILRLLLLFFTRVTQCRCGSYLSSIASVVGVGTRRSIELLMGLERLPFLRIAFEWLTTFHFFNTYYYFC